MKIKDIKKRFWLSHNKRDSAFTLVEVLIAMVILMIGILAVASMQIMSMRGNVHARNTTGRTTAAQYYIEQIMALNYDHANLTDGDHTFDPDTPEDLTSLPEGITALRWNVTDINSGTSKIITVTVEWDGGGSTSIRNEKPSLN